MDQPYLPEMDSEERRADLSQWFTPPAVAERLWELACRDGYPGSVIEPAAGRGALIRPLVEQDVCTRVVAYEIDPVHADELWLMFGNLVEVRCRDFLAHDVGEHFDLCLMNPPYENNQDVAFILKGLEVADRVVGVFRADVFHSKKRCERLWDSGVYVVRGARARGRWKFGGNHSPSKNYVALELGRGETWGGSYLERWEWWD